MTRLLMIREQIKNFVNKFDTFVYPVAKALLALTTFLMINGAIGHVPVLMKAPIVLILAIICSFLPTNFIIILDAVMILLHLYAISLECVIVVGCLLLIMFLLYFRFSPKDTILFLLTPLLHIMGIPYVAALSAGLVSGIGSAVSICCSTIIFCVLDYISKNTETIKAMASDQMIEKFRVLLDVVIKNKEMMVLVVAFAATIIIVNIIRRLPADHAWTVAIIAGALVDIVVVLAGDLKFGTYISIPGLILGSFVAVLVVIVIKFFIFNVDYGRTEHVQFEDDEYVYFVKAVPKNTVTIPEKKVRTIKASTMEEEEYEEIDDVPEYKVKRAGGSGAGNKSATKRIILPKDNEFDVERHATRKDSAGLTAIEREAAQKAKEARRNRS